MKLDFKHMGLLLLQPLFVVLLTAQQKAMQYYFEGEEVVFQFDRRAYEKAVAEDTGESVDFSDLDIKEVLVKGNFKHWRKKGWTMKQVGPHTFQLRKRMEDFKDPFTWKLKFIINGRYRAEGPKPQATPYQMDELWSQVFDTPYYDVNPDKAGNTTFRLEGHRGAHQVILAGDFNGWNEKQLKMEARDWGWELTLELKPGYYEYKFIADGKWMHDPKNPERRRNQHHTFNSVLRVTKVIRFQLQGFAQAKKVFLAGSFNDWKPKQLPMKHEKGHWVLAMDLIGGKHLYKFIVDDHWIVDPGNPLQEYDRHKNLNSVLFVR